MAAGEHTPSAPTQPPCPHTSSKQAIKQSKRCCHTNDTQTQRSTCRPTSPGHKIAPQARMLSHMRSHLLSRGAEPCSGPSKPKTLKNPWAVKQQNPGQHHNTHHKQGFRGATARGSPAYGCLGIYVGMYNMNQAATQRGTRGVGDRKLMLVSHCTSVPSPLFLHAAWGHSSQ